jgi:integrase/recombinase XerD
MPDKPINPLRQRLIDDMTARRYSEKVQKAYVRHVRTFAAFLSRSPDTATSDDLRRFQLHMAQQQISPGSINAAIGALRFFFTVTLERPDLVRPLRLVNEPRKAPVVLSQEEVARLLEAAPGLKYKAALCVAYGAGLRVSEVANLKVSDIDSERMTLRVEQGKGQRDRYVMLSPQLLELLRDWWRAARPQVWLFPGQNPVNPITPPSAQSRGHRRQGSGGHLQACVATHPAAQLRHPSARAGRRYSRDPGVARTRQARDDGALHPRRRQHSPRHQEPARAAGDQPREPIAACLTGPRAAASP